MKQGLDLTRVVLLGRTFEEYLRFFALDPAALKGKAILDVAAGVSSFCAEATARGLDVTAADRIYSLPADQIQTRCEPDLEQVAKAMEGLPVYRWDFYRDAAHMREFRQRAYTTFLADYRVARSKRYLPIELPHLPFTNGQFHLSLLSYLLFVYEDQFPYEFHQQSILELMRVTSGEARIYPVVTLEAQPSTYINRLMTDPALAHLRFEKIQTDFEFLRNSNFYLRITRAE